MTRRQPSLPPSAAKPKRKKARPGWDSVELVQMPEATRFSDDPDIDDAVQVIRMLKRQPQFLSAVERELALLLGKEPEDALDPCSRPGPKRGVHAKGGKGNWLLLYFGFVLMRQSAMFHFTRYPGTLKVLFRECGFREMPDYQLVRLRFIELEQHWQAVKQLADAVIQQARRHEPRIGQFVHVDACAFETQARLEHCCPRDAECWKRGRGHGKARPERAEPALIKEEREKEAKLALADDEIPDNLIHAAYEKGRYRYFLIGGCYYRAADRECGLRRYQNPDGSTKKVWLGGFGMSAIDSMFGAPLASETFAADATEHYHYEPLMEGVRDALAGENPLAITGDAGESYYHVFRYNSEREIASVIPWRPRGGQKTREMVRCDAYDEYGVPRCRYCGGETEQRRFYLDKRDGKPYVRYRCTEQLLPECEAERRIACETNWGMLLPLSRLHPLYYDLHAAHQSFERVHGLWRRRYSVFGDDQTGRLKRFSSVSAQRLRAQAARFLEWFRICLRHGFLAGHKRLNLEPPFSRQGLGSSSYQGMLVNRRKKLLDLPYGEAARRLGLWLPPPDHPPNPPPDGGREEPF